MKKFVFGMIILLAVLHQDFWFWDSTYAVFGFLPIGLFYHALVSLSAGFLWWLAIKHCWPEGVDVDESNPPAGGESTT